MKLTLLSLALLLGSCQTTDTASSSPIDPASAPALPAPALTAPAAAAPMEAALPRWNHLDRAQFAVRSWVRDRG